jgi:hypothetical protein
MVGKGKIRGEWERESMEDEESCVDGAVCV